VIRSARLQPSEKRVTIIELVVLLLCAASTPTAGQQAHTSEVTFTATSANVGEIGSPIKIHILRWSTDAEREPILAALNARPQVAAPASSSGRGGAGRGRGRGARGGEPAPLTPMAALAAALGKAPTIGYIWTKDVTGYSIKYARRLSQPGGGERIVLATNRRLDAYAAAWKPVTATSVTDDEFTLIEIHLDAKGSGEGKASFVTRVIVDQDAKTIALDDYDGTLTIFQNVKRWNGVDRTP
jgi:hypothetical protein